jgi:hypothetical protein
MLGGTEGTLFTMEVEEEEEENERVKVAEGRGCF